MAGYKAGARTLDWGMGMVLDAVAASGLAENTVIICTTDHGPAFPGIKSGLLDHGIGVMLIIRGPAGFSGGKVCDALVSQIDVYPTICELVGLERPPWLQGRSLMPLVREEAAEVDEEIFAEVTYHAAYEPQRAVRTKRWKYIRRYADRALPVLPNVDSSPSKDFWLRHGWRQRLVAREQLYDLVFDSNEAHNLALDPGSAEAVGDMRARLDRWMRATDDPLLHGDIALPPGGKTDDPDALSPT